LNEYVTHQASPKVQLPKKRPRSTSANNLAQRDSLISQLSRLLDSEATLTSSALKQNNLARHREVLADHRRELQRLTSAIAESRDRANLLSNVRSDIDAYRASNPDAAEADYMLEERGRVENSHNMMDGVLSQAYAINENFGIQRETLASINRRIVGAASQVPGMNYLIGKIGTKKRRDAIILGCFIGFCFLMLVFFR
jgi:Golgi SNAP receptor complex protein 1